MKALVPVKRFRFAKQRLAAAMPAALRERLARAMAEHVLTELAKSLHLDEVVIVSAEPSLVAVAGSLGFGVIADREVGLNAALQEAADRLAWPADDDVAIVHADLPLFSHREFDRVAALHRDGASLQLTLVPDNAAQGTNLRFCRPGFAVPMLFGPRSAANHLRAADRAGLAVEWVSRSALSLDCDVACDIPRILDDARSAAMPERLHALLTMINVSASALEDIAS